MRLAAFIAIVAATGCGGAEQAATDPAPKEEERPSGRVVLGPDSPGMERIELAEVRSARVALEVVAAPGKIEANPNRIARVTMPVPGRVTAVLVGIGDAVRQGQPVLAVESPEITAALSELRQARAALSEARALAAKADADLERVRDLFEFRAIARKELVAAETAQAQALAEIERARSREDEALARLTILGLDQDSAERLIVVRAPLSGKVLEIAVSPGEYRNDTSEPLMVLADLSSVYMTADVPESLIRLVHVGEQVEIRIDAYPDEVFGGRVKMISDTVDPVTRSVRVRTELANPRGRLRPEMFGRIVHEETFRDLPVVPPGAVLRDAGGAYVFREVASGVFERTPVEIGRPGPAGVPVLDGLREGDRIVVRGGVLLRPS